MYNFFFNCGPQNKDGYSCDAKGDTKFIMDAMSTFIPSMFALLLLYLLMKRYCTARVQAVLPDLAELPLLRR